MMQQALSPTQPLPMRSRLTCRPECQAVSDRRTPLFRQIAPAYPNWSRVWSTRQNHCDEILARCQISLDDSLIPVTSLSGTGVTFLSVIYTAGSPLGRYGKSGGLGGGDAGFSPL